MPSRGPLYMESALICRMEKDKGREEDRLRGRYTGISIKERNILSRKYFNSINLKNSSYKCHRESQEPIILTLVAYAMILSVSVV
jgi:hypothetical protein